jgi:hypothetical protein
MRKAILYILATFALSACSGPTPENFIEPTITTLPSKTITQELRETDTPVVGNWIDVNRHQCLGDFNEFAYGYEVEPEGDFHFVYPLPPWKLVRELPDDGNYWTLGKTKHNNKLEIWLVKSYENQGHEHDEIVIFVPSTSEITMFPLESNQKGIAFFRIYFFDDGMIWGKNELDSNDQNLSEGIPLLSKFNREERRFIVDENSPVISNQLSDITYQNLDVWPDSENTFWYFLPEKGLYRYDPASGTTDNMLQLMDFKVMHETMDGEGNIYFMGTHNDIDHWNIYRYSTSDDELKVITSLESLFSRHRIFVDHNGQIWLDLVKKIDPSGKQTILHPDLETYHEIVVKNPGHSYIDPAEVFFESSNGYLWLSKRGYNIQGMAWYDPKSGKGCWYTNRRGGILEDDNHHIWYVADHYLYKLELNTLK